MKIRIASVALMLLVAASNTFAQTWPSRTVSFVTSSGPGGQSDSVLRQLASELEKRLGQSFVVQNRPGANTTISVQHGVRARPDGYTFLFAGMGGHAPVFTKHNSALLNEEMTPVVQVYSTDWFIAVRSALPVKTFAELVEWSQTNDLKVGSATPGVVLGLAMLNNVLVNSGSKPLKYRIIPYRTDPAVLVDMLANQIDLTFVSPSPLIPYLKEGTVRALATSGKVRSELMGDVPTLSEMGADYTMMWDIGLWAPKGTPKEVVDKLNAQVREISTTPQFQERLKSLGVKAESGTPEDLLANYEKALKFWKKGAELADYEPI